jgi:hypothetical protein
MLGLQVYLNVFEDFDRVKVLKYFLKDNGNGENSKLLN